MAFPRRSILPVLRNAFLFVVLMVILFPQHPSSLRSAVAYLVGAIDPDIGLAYEASGGGVLSHSCISWQSDKIFWLYNDNFLVSLALTPYKPDKAKRISEVLASYQVSPPGRFEVLAGRPIDVGRYNSMTCILVARIKDKVVLTEVPDYSASPLWTIEKGGGPYADILFLQSLAYWLRGDKETALVLYEQASQLWDSKGLADASYRSSGLYETYKLALWRFTANVFGKPFPISAERVMWKMQAPSGGFVTHYDASLVHKGSVNTETTSLVVLAYDTALHKLLRRK